MSLAACQWVWDECPAKNGDRLVLLALAVFADNSGRCFCPAEVLMAKTRMCKRNVGRAVERCVEAGWLEIEQEARWERGSKLARNFRIKLGDNLSDQLGDNLSEMGGNLSPRIKRIIRTIRTKALRRLRRLRFPCLPQ